MLVMKNKIVYVVLLPLAGMILFSLAGCDRDEESPGSREAYVNRVVYEDASLREQVSPHFYDNHIYRIELLGANHERDQLVREALGYGIEEGFLMIEEAQKFFFNHTGVIMYSIPTIDPEQTLILYESRGLYQVSMALFRPAEGGLMSFALLTMDDREYFSLKLDDQSRIGELKVFENEKINSFNRAVYSLTLTEESPDLKGKSVSAPCCRQESSWSDCMDCTVSDCGDSWVCKAVAMIAPVELLAGFAASCIGAGPDSRC
jgi:hypothetical protein